MGASLQDTSIVQDDNFICICHRGESVGDDQGRSSGHQLVECLLDELFAAGIQALVASSSISIFGSRSSARAIAMRCFCPPESWTPRSPTSVSQPSENRSINSENVGSGGDGLQLGLGRGLIVTPISEVLAD